MGKSTLYRNHFGPAGYEHISQDVLGSRAKCIKATGEALASRKSCVIGELLAGCPGGIVGHSVDHARHPDNTNRDGQTRKHYIEIAKKFDVPVR